MKKQTHIIFLISFAILNLFAFQNFVNEGPDLSVNLENDELFAANQKNVFMINQDSESQDYKLESLFTEDKDKFVQFLLKKDELPFKTKHGYITKFDKEFGTFSYEPEKNFYGEDSIDFIEESLQPREGSESRVENKEEGRKTIYIHNLKFRMIVKAPMTIRLGTSSSLTESPSITLFNPMLTDNQNKKIQFEASITPLTESQQEGRAFSNWIKLTNKEKIKGLNLEGSAQYLVRIRNIQLPGYQDEVLSASWKTTDLFFNIELGDIPESLSQTPTIKITSLTKPMEDEEITFDAQISYFLHNEKKILTDVNGSDWFTEVKNGASINNLNLESKIVYTLEVRNIKSALKPISNPSVSWTPQFTELVVPKQLEAIMEENGNPKALEESPQLTWGPKEVVRKISQSKNLKFELALFDTERTDGIPIFQGILNVGSDGKVKVNTRFEDGKSYGFKVRIVSVDALGKFIKSETEFSELSPTWKVNFQVHCQLEVNPPIGVNCTDGTIFLGYNQSRAIRIYTLANNGQYPTSLKYQEASQACEDLNSQPKFAKVQGWRLPTDTEALLIMFYKKQKTYDLSFKADDGYYTQPVPFYPLDKISNYVSSDTYIKNNLLSFPDLGFGVGYEGAGYIWTSKALNGSNGVKIVDYHRTISPTMGGFGGAREGGPDSQNPYFCVRSE